MASHNPCPGPVPTMSDHERESSQPLQETPENGRYDSSFSQIYLPHPVADPILIQNRSPGTRESGYCDNSYSENLKSHSFSCTGGTSASAFEPTGSLDIPPPMPVGGTTVGPSNAIIKGNFASEEANSSLSSGGPPVGPSNAIIKGNFASEEANSSLSSGGPPVGNSAFVTRRMTTKRVFLRSDEEKAQLVRLCIANFGDFVRGKERFWSKISILYQQQHPDGAAPNVKGYMQRFAVHRKKEVEETLSKSGIAESATEWQQSMDHWLELVRDCEDQLKEVKNISTKEDAYRKKELVTLRENMTKSLMRKRGLPELASSPIMVEDSGEGEPATALRDSDSLGSDGFPNKKHRSRDTGAEPAGDRVFASQRRTTDRILNSLREGDQEMLKQIREMEFEKMDRWKEILGGGNRSDNQVLGERIEQLEKQGKETQETLANIVSILQNLEGQSR